MEGKAVAFTGSLALLILIFADRVADIVGGAAVLRADCEGDIIGAMAGLLKFKSRSMTSDDRKMITTTRALRFILTPAMHYPSGIYL